MPDNAAMPKFDVSTENLRIYTFKDGSTFTIHSPVDLYVKRREQGDSHRVVDAAGMVHHVADWVAISWLPKNPSQPVDF